MGSSHRGAWRTGVAGLVLAEGAPLRLPPPADVRRRLEHSVRQWQEWTGNIDYEARSLLEGALAYANDLDQWSEEIDPTHVALPGNFPIGLSHLAVVGAVTSHAAARERAGTV
ncbi:MAG: hypothetical protein ACRDYZ_04055 [Acidimicrobiales bacterium]